MLVSKNNLQEKEKTLKIKFRNWEKNFQIRKIDLGFTNQNYVLDEKWFLRRSQPNTRFLTQIENQIALLPFLNKTDISLKAYDYFFDTKKKFHFITKFLSDSTTFKNELKNYLNLKKIANLIKSLQDLPVKFPTLTVLDLETNLTNHFPSGYQKISPPWKKKIDLIFSFLKTLDQKNLVVAHNDLVSENILVSKTKKYYLIDFEYCALNIPEYDIAVFACENKLFLSDDLWKYWLSLFNITTSNEKKKIVYLMFYHELLIYFWIIKTKTSSSDHKKYVKLSQEKKLNINHLYEVLQATNSSFLF